jgi:hypothetical protein
MERIKTAKGPPSKASPLPPLVTLGAPYSECVFGADARNDFGEAFYSSFYAIAPLLTINQLGIFLVREITNNKLMY